MESRRFDATALSAGVKNCHPSRSRERARVMTIGVCCAAELLVPELVEHQIPRAANVSVCVKSESGCGARDDNCSQLRTSKGADAGGHALPSLGKHCRPDLLILLIAPPIQPIFRLAGFVRLNGCR